MALNVEIPEAQLPALKWLLELPNDQADALLSALRSEAPDLLLSSMAKQLAAKLPLPAEELADSLMMLASMYLTSRSRSDPDERFIEGVIVAARKSALLVDSDIDWEHAQQLLVDLLACEGSLGITAKAIGVTADHEKAFARARILTDMRPIFGQEIGDKPAAAVVVHTLRIAYHSHYQKNDSAFYVALDTRDLQSLQEQITRALAKERAIAQTVSSIPLLVLSSQEEKWPR